MPRGTWLNAWFESRTLGRRVLKKIDFGIADDLPDGLFVPVLRDAANRDAADLRRGLDRMRADLWRVGSRRKKWRRYHHAVEFWYDRRQLCGANCHTTDSSNSGAGRIREQVVAVSGVPAVHRVLPLAYSTTGW